ncbi:GNAT family N-acetyltransferase [Pseudomonas sp. ODNR1LW]|nr:GNAT family N-acetyltransferase [Pseudomonas sp. ODNR1LW]
MGLPDRRIFIQNNGVDLCAWNEVARSGYARLVADPQVMTFISDGKPREKERADQEVDAFNRELQVQGWSRWAVHHSETGAFCGYAGFAQKEYGVNYGQRLFPKLWRSRVSMTATQLALEYGFLTLGFDQIHTLTNIEHTLAIRINRNYLGVGEDYGVVCETPHGPHLRIDVPRDLFLSRLALNRQRIFSRGRLEASIPEAPPVSGSAKAIA